jgi:flagellar biosynthesis protein FlhF
MIIRTFESDTLRGAMRLVQEGLGDDAIILRTRRIDGPRPDGASRWEVTVRALSLTELDLGTEPLAGDTLQETPAVAADEVNPVVSLPQAHLRDVSHRPSDLDVVRRDLESLREHAASWTGLEHRLDKALETLHTEVVQLGRYLQTATGDGRNRDPLMRGLVTSGVEPGIATAIVQRARARVAPDEGLAVAKAPDLLSELIHALPTCPPLWAPAMPGRHGSSPMALHALLGPTGAGKTRTLVKLATSAAFGHDRRVAIVTIDVHRIGGIETLRAFSGILGIPMRKATNRRELIGTLRELGQCDVVLIDTPGCSHWDDGTLARTADTLNVPGMERHLVLPATMRAEEVALVSKRFGAAGLSSIIVTKLDEARGPGALLSATWGSGAKLSHICDGQDVPEGCHAAEAKQWVTQIMTDAA